MSQKDIFTCVIVVSLTALIIYSFSTSTNTRYLNTESQPQIFRNMLWHTSVKENHTVRNIKPENTIHIATIITGQLFYRLGFTLIKSIIFTTKQNVNCYIFTKDDAVEKMNLDIQPWPMEIKSRLNIYQLEEYTGSDLHFPINKKGKMDMKMLAYAAILQSKIVAERTSKLIYIDADLCAMDDLWKLWKVFDTFGKNHTIATAIGRRYAQYRTEKIFLGLGINAGVMLMDLKKLMQLSFMTEYLKGSKNKATILKTYDDQDLLCLFFKRFPEQHLLLSCIWNFRQSMNICTKVPRFLCKEVEEMGVGLVHATSPLIFTHSEFSQAYSCIKALNFSQIPETLSCLGNAFESFKNGSIECHYKQKYLENLEYIVNHYYYD